MNNNIGTTRSTLLTCCILATLVAAVFWQVTNFDFVNFDDPIYVTENKHIKQGLNLETVRWAFTTHLHGHFHPLTWLNHATDCLFFGLDPAGHHFSSFLLHLINTLLLFLVLRNMTGAIWASGFAAALFAVHPLHVEPVAWVADRKDLLCGLFWISALWVYCKAVEHKSIWYHLLLMLVYILGLLSKTMMITLPLVLLFLDFWPLKRLRTSSGGFEEKDSPSTSLTKLLAEKSGLLVIAIFFVFITTGAMKDIGVEAKTLSPYWQYDFLLYFMHYVEKMFWPVRLTVLYPYNETPEVAFLILSGVFLLSITILTFLLRRRFPFLLTGWLWFTISLMPVVGLIHGGPHRVTDRYTYIPLIGICIALAWTWKKIAGQKTALSTVLACGLILTLSLLSFQQTARWKTSLDLFEHAISVYPNNWVAHNNLGDALDKNNRKDEAINHYRIALQIHPLYAEANYNMGNIMASLNRGDEALHYYLRAIAIYPEFTEAYNNIGVLLEKNKRYLEAREYFVSAVKLKPDYEDAIRNLQDISLTTKDLEEQIDFYIDKLQANPEDANLHNNLGLLYREGGDVRKAEYHFQEALRIDPSFAGAHNNLGILFAEQGNYSQAAVHFRHAVNLDPDFTGARVNLERINSFSE